MLASELKDVPPRRPLDYGVVEARESVGQAIRRAYSVYVLRQYWKRVAT